MDVLAVLEKIPSKTLYDVLTWPQTMAAERSGRTSLEIRAAAVMAERPGLGCPPARSAARS
jgi:hypothetical protein